MSVNFVGLFLLCPGLLAAAAEPQSMASSVSTDERGWLVHPVLSPYQSGPTAIRVLLPKRLDPDRRYPVVYVLPVEPREETRYGDGLLEVHQHDLHNEHQAIFVGPTFSDWPWYADHPTDDALRQETYFLNVVLPFVERTYPVSRTPRGRLLLGFSKSGWGAWSLLLRHPDTFGFAAAWDAPLMMTEVGSYGTGSIFGTQARFENYRPADLLRAKAAILRHDQRLILAGYGNFRQHHQQAHALLEDLAIPHEYRDGPQRKHDWHSGWVAEAVQSLFEAASPPVSRPASRLGEPPAESPTTRPEGS